MTAPPLAIGPLHIAAAIAAAIWLVVAVLLWRRGKLSGEQKFISVVGVLALAVFSTGVFDFISEIDQILENVASALGKWTYLLVTVLAFLETGAFVGLVAPGEAAVIVGGVVAGQGEIDIRLLIGLVWFAAFMGDSVSFYLGHRLGREFLVKHGPRVKITEDRLVQVEKYMHQHGGKTILVGRFIGLVRALAPFIAGSSKMPYRRFMPYDIIGSGLWAAFFCLLGYVFSNNLHDVIHYAERGVLIFGWLIALIVAAVYLVRRFRKPEERAKLEAWFDEQEKNPRKARFVRPARKVWTKVVLPIYTTIQPQLRFFWARITPGRLGLEFTTTMAVLVVAAYTFYFFLIAALDWPTNSFVNRLNDAAFRVSDSLRTDWLDDLAEIVTWFGRFPVVLVPTLLVAGFCFYRRRGPEAVVLLLTLALAATLVPIVKDWTAVPRPPGGMTAAEGYAFPSGHAAYAVMYVLLAICFERVRDLLARAALVIVAIAFGGAIALSRVYLHVHYLSDVIGGTALTFMIASLLAALAMLFNHARTLRRERAAEAVGKVDASP